MRLAQTLIALAVLVVGCKGSESAGKPATPSASAPASSATASTSANANAMAATSASAIASGDAGARIARTTGGVAGAAETRFVFDADAAGAAPAGFTSLRTGSGRVGSWIVRAEGDGPGAPMILAQTDADPTDNRFPMLLADAPVLADVQVSVRCKPVSGKVDQACGVVCRAKGADDYYLARANALEGNVRLYVVEHGKRRQLESYSGAVTGGQWHKLALWCHGAGLSVYWDEARVLRQADKTFTEAGKVGLWTKADSVTYFDALVVREMSNM